MLWLLGEVLILPFPQQVSNEAIEVEQLQLQFSNAIAEYPIAYSFSKTDHVLLFPAHVSVSAIGSFQLFLYLYCNFSKEFNLVLYIN